MSVNWLKALRQDGFHKVFDIVPVWYWRGLAIDISKELGLWPCYFSLRLDQIRYFSEKSSGC